MNILNINQNEIFSARSLDKTAKNSPDYKGPTFSENMCRLAQVVNLQVADGSSTAGLNFKRQKEETLDKLFSFTETEEEILENSFLKITKLLKELKK
jgi:hypothetical protein